MKKQTKLYGAMAIYACALTAAIVVFAACERRPLEIEYTETAKIPVGVVWDKSGIDPQNVTVLFYDQTTGALSVEHRYENNDNRIQSYVDVPVGNYTVVFFNELRNQIRNVGIRGHENLATLEAYALPANSVVERAAGDDYIGEPDVLASAVVRDFEVTPDMVSRTGYIPANSGAAPSDIVVTEELVGVVADRQTGTCHITVHVRGLHNARMPALVDLRNLAGGYFFDAGRNSTALVTRQFSMNNRTYDAGSNHDGTISAAIRTFGVVGDRNTVADQPSSAPVMLDMLFMLVDAERTVVNVSVDVTDLIRFSPENDGSIRLDVTIDLTDPLPDVRPDGGDDSGFGTDLIDWDIIYVPINSN